jgi:hypothetical protein
MFHRGRREVISSLRFSHHIINVGLDVLPDLILKAVLDGSLVCSASILKPEGHGGVAVGTEWRDE